MSIRQRRNLGKMFLLVAAIAVSIVVFLPRISWSKGQRISALAVAVEDDPLVRMPGSQPADGITLEAPKRCMNCHDDYDAPLEPGRNWKGSMMAQAMRDPIFWACLTVSAQDSMWALGNTNATDLCLRCHSPGGWLGGRSTPTNGSAMTADDFDGVHCDTCHSMIDPFYMTTYNGTRETNDWINYWDEAGNNGPGSNPLTQSQDLADQTLAADMAVASVIKFFNGDNFYANNEPFYNQTYTENGGGQFFVSGTGTKRASFSDAEARHAMEYSRYHKSKYFCQTCHDVSNPALANLGLSGLPDQSGGQDLISEQYSAHRYLHVERTFSEFMLSAYGQNYGAPTNPEFQQQGAPDITRAGTCQDCHMRDVVGWGCGMNNVPLRPDESTEHPNSGHPLHDMTGGNAWVSHILASLDPNGPVYDPTNAQLLLQGASVLTIDFTAGQTPVKNGAQLKAGSDRALAQLQMAGTIKDVVYNGGTGAMSFRVLNNTGHKLISGFPEGRRMWVNIKLLNDSGQVLHEINPYDMAARTMPGLGVEGSPALTANQTHLDELVYEAKTSSSLTGEDKTFHFVLADGRYKDNRIPPRGFDIANADARLCQPVWDGHSRSDLFTAAEYAGGYDQVDIIVPTGAASAVVTLYYQGTSREYIKFLRDEINGTGTTTLPAEAYIAQSDPFFAKLKAWGNTIWQLWLHNHDQQVPGIVPVRMSQALAEATYPPQSGDFDGDGVVDAADLALLLGHWGQTLQPAGWTTNWDGFVDANELAAVLANWGAGL